MTSISPAITAYISARDWHKPADIIPNKVQFLLTTNEPSDVIVSNEL